jgi:tripartite-type tricarboxylate transporter receptor subunit TctC
MVPLSRRTILAGLAALAAPPAGAADADFYRGKTLTVIVGFAPGGGVDTTTRIVAQNLVRFIPGRPDLIVQNLEGAAGVVATNHLETRVVPDGLTLAIPGRSWFVDAIVHEPGIRYDVTKIAYIGSPGEVNSVLYLRKNTGISSFAALEAAKKPVTMGALASNTATAMVPNLLARQGLPFKVVTGYGSSARILIALEQGEVDGFFTVEGTFARREDLITRGVVTPILQSRPEHPRIPVLADILPKSDTKLLALVLALESFGLPLVGPSAMPKTRIAILRRAFLAMARDARYQRDAVKVDLPVGAPISGARLVAMIAELVRSATPDIVARYRALAAGT